MPWVIRTVETGSRRGASERVWVDEPAPPPPSNPVVRAHESLMPFAMLVCVLGAIFGIVSFLAEQVH